MNWPSSACFAAPFTLLARHSPRRCSLANSEWSTRTLAIRPTIRLPLHRPRPIRIQALAIITHQSKADLQVECGRTHLPHSIAHFAYGSHLIPHPAPLHAARHENDRGGRTPSSPSVRIRFVRTLLASSSLPFALRSSQMGTPSEGR